MLNLLANPGRRTAAAACRGSKGCRRLFHDNAIFINGVARDVGKTSVAMATLAGLTRVFGHGRVAYFKPVGQHFELDSDGRKVDKDAVLARSHFGMRAQLRHMSPIIIDEGYTRRFLDGDPALDGEEQLAVVEEAFFELQRDHDFVVIEGMGHCAAGSIVGLGNAAIANRLGVDAILVANGGLGSTFDELELNRQLLENWGVALRGIIINKFRGGDPTVRTDKYESVRSYLAGAASERWGVPLLGCIPLGAGFDRPSLRDLEYLYETSLLSARDHALRRFAKYELVTTSLGRFMAKLNASKVMSPVTVGNTCSLSEPVLAAPLGTIPATAGAGLAQTCFVTHTSRIDIVLGLLSHAHDRGLTGRGEHSFQGGLLLTGQDTALPAYVKEYLAGSDFPVLKTGMSTTKSIKLLEGFTAKMHADDTARTDAIVQLYEPHMDIGALLAGGGVGSGGGRQQRPVQAEKLVAG